MHTKPLPPTPTSAAAAAVSEQKYADATQDGTKTALPMADIEAAIRGIRFGVVQIIIQDGVVVQIDRTEKSRLR